MESGFVKGKEQKAKPVLYGQPLLTPPQNLLSIFLKKNALIFFSKLLSYYEELFYKFALAGNNNRHPNRIGVTLLQATRHPRNLHQERPFC